MAGKNALGPLVAIAMLAASGAVIATNFDRTRIAPERAVLGPAAPLPVETPKTPPKSTPGAQSAPSAVTATTAKEVRPAAHPAPEKPVVKPPAPQPLPAQTAVSADDARRAADALFAIVLSDKDDVAPTPAPAPSVAVASHDRTMETLLKVLAE